MGTLYQLLAFVGAGIIIWLLYATIKNKPEQFTKANLGKSFFSMGILGLVLICFVAFLVFMLKHT